MTSLAVKGRESGDKEHLVFFCPASYLAPEFTAYDH
jgi:hypothetical protein